MSRRHKRPTPERFVKILEVCKPTETKEDRDVQDLYFNNNKHTSNAPFKVARRARLLAIENSLFVLLRTGTTREELLLMINTLCDYYKYLDALCGDSEERHERWMEQQEALAGAAKNGRH